ncbi:WecB/TagA/CpsF family glycosyltransferase [Abyssisolibacter fermentans]|uniref:WecB/TagA/CpsF family glycosyltransferase n=1 Tax=Abyssisolibacter fermentans TaxID=1766203 RepID=UPI0008302B62|nr:WecB/TagA/CpsF family glycosyltransferase [Abyssisolibacter fermentans]
MNNVIKIMGVAVNNTTLVDAVKTVEKALENNNQMSIYTPNTEIVMEARSDNTLCNMINRGDLIIPDGVGLIYASKIKKKPLKERVTGVDLSTKLLSLCDKKGYSLYILGGKEGTAQRAVDNIMKKYTNIKIAGIHNGYFKGTHIGYEGHDEEKAVIEDINNSGAEVLFVCLGAPKQELWIDKNRDKLNCKVMIGNGGTVDILAGDVKRAPLIYQKLGLEWLHRLIKQPSRIKRQMALPKFVLLLLFSREKLVE